MYFGDSAGSYFTASSQVLRLCLFLATTVIRWIYRYRCFPPLLPARVRTLKSQLRAVVGTYNSKDSSIMTFPRKTAAFDCPKKSDILGCLIAVITDPGRCVCPLPLCYRNTSIPLHPLFIILSWNDPSFAYKS